MFPPRGPAPPGPGQMGMPRGPGLQQMGQGSRPPMSTNQVAISRKMISLQYCQIFKQF